MPRRPAASRRRTPRSRPRGERFLRAGFPKSETLLLLAIKMHDFEATLPTLLAGRTVIEGRSIHSTAVYQLLIWRPLPDLTIVITDDVEAAVGRAEARDGAAYTAEQWQLHRHAAALFEHLATIDPEHMRLLDRRQHDVEALVATLSEWIATAPARPLAPAVIW